MPHESIIPDDHGEYYEGDALDINVIVKDRAGAKRKDITGSTVEFRLKETHTDDDASALLEKSSSNVGEVDLTDPTDGKVTIHIDTGDTDGLLTDVDRAESETFYWHVRVTDSEGKRVTVANGDWVIHAS